jgi:glycosyltransferase involved in cell wall biosynthesis
VTINDALAQNYIENGIPEEKILVLPDGVDLERFTPPLTKQQARETIGLNPELFIASYVGHLYENRGIETIFECAKLLPEVFFHLVGGCEEDVKRRKEEAQSMKLDNVKMEGFVPNSKVPYYLASADVLLMPYSRNCKTANWMSPLKLFEYMAAQKPIIASDLQAIRQVLNSHNAVLIEPDYANHLANAIVNLKNNPGMMEKIAFLARKDAEKFTWQNRAREILNFSQSKLSFYLNDFRNNSNGEAKRKK